MSDLLWRDVAVGMVLEVRDWRPARRQHSEQGTAVYDLALLQWLGFFSEMRDAEHASMRLAAVAEHELLNASLLECFWQGSSHGIR